MKRVLLSLALGVGLLAILSTVALAANAPYELWVANQVDDQISIYSSDGWQVTDVIQVNEGGFSPGAKPHMIFFSPSAKYAYVSNVGAKADSNNITVIRAADRKIVAQIPTVASAHAAIPSPDGKRIWVQNTAANTVTEILADEAAEKWTVSRTFKLGIRPICGVFTPDGKHIYISIGGNADELGALAIVDVESLEVVKRVETGREGCGTVLSRDNSKIYVNTGYHPKNQLHLNDVYAVYDPTTHEQVFSTQVPDAKDLHGLSETLDGQELWILGRQSNTLSVYDTATNQLKQTYNVGSRPDLLAFSPDGKHAFWTLRGEPQTGDPHALRGTNPGIEVYDVATKSYVAFIPLPGGDAHGIIARSALALPAVLPATGTITGYVPLTLGLLGLGLLLSALGLHLRRAKQ